MLGPAGRSEEHTSELQSRLQLVCRLLLEKKKKKGCSATSCSREGEKEAMDWRRNVRWTVVLSVFFFNDTATTEIYTLSLHDALPISGPAGCALHPNGAVDPLYGDPEDPLPPGDRKSTRLNSSHGYISYAVFCLK